MRSWIKTACMLIVPLSALVFVYGAMKVAEASNPSSASGVDLTVPGVKTVAVDERTQSLGSRAVAVGIIGVLVGGLGLTLTWRGPKPA